MRSRAGAAHRAGATWTALSLAALVSGCDRFNDARVFARFSDPAVQHQLRKVFVAPFSQGDTTCWTVGEDADAFAEFDRTVWSFVVCWDHETGIWASFGSCDGAAFANLQMTSSGLRSQPDAFVNLRSEIIDAFTGIVGADAVEVVDSPEPAYFEPLHEVAEQWRRGQGGQPEQPR